MGVGKRLDGFLEYLAQIQYVISILQEETSKPPLMFLIARKLLHTLFCFINEKYVVSQYFAN